MQSNYLIYIIPLIIIFIGIMYFTFSKSKEGFQTSAQVNTPASCGILDSTLERININLQKSIDANNKSAIKTIQTTIDSINAEKKNLGC